MGRGGFWLAALVMAGILVLAYDALEHSGGVRQLGNTGAQLEGATAGGISRMVAAFQGRAG